MYQEYCYFASRLTLKNYTEIMCRFDKKYVDREVCEKCPYYISESEVDNMVRRLVFERGVKL